MENRRPNLPAAMNLFKSMGSIRPSKIQSLLNFEEDTLKGLCRRRADYGAGVPTASKRERVGVRYCSQSLRYVA
jgi:hypothetical protein